MSVMVNSVGTVGGEIEQGIIYKSVDSEGYPLDITIKAVTIPQNSFYGANDTFLSKLEKLEVIADSTGYGMFSSRFNNTTTLEKIKLKIKSIGDQGFSSLAATSKKAVKVWVSKECIEMKTHVFYDMPGTVYCEAESIPSGWASNWTNANTSVIWGVSESAFDLL